MPFLGTQPAETALTTGDLGADIVTNAKIADDQIDSEHYVNGSIDTAHIAANAIDGTLTKDALIADYSDVTITASDLIMYGDATDSNNTKRDTVQGILDLAGGGSRKVLAVTTASGSSSAINFTAFDNSAYDSYEFIVHYWKPSGDGIECWVRTSTDGGFKLRQWKLGLFFL